VVRSRSSARAAFDDAQSARRQQQRKTSQREHGSRLAAQWGPSKPEQDDAPLSRSLRLSAFLLAHRRADVLDAGHTDGRWRRVRGQVSSPQPAGNSKNHDMNLQSLLAMNGKNSD
jgi:hypothetical protein